MNSRLLLAWMLAVTVLLLQRPVSAPGLWWHLSRGREVASGSISPCSQLLSLDVTTEADWCSGLLFFEMWNIGGVHLLAAVPILAASLLLLSLGRSLSQSLSPTTRIIVIPLFLLTLRDGLQPVPELFDLFGLTLLGIIVNADISTRVRFVSITIAFTAWANFGPRPILGLLWLFYQGLASRQKSPSEFNDATSKISVATFPALQTIPLLIAGIIGGLVTPRGMLTWRDSAMLFFPTAFHNPHGYSNPDWIGAFEGISWTISEYAFLALWSLWVAKGIANIQVLPDPQNGIVRISRSTHYPELLRYVVGRFIPFAAVVLCRNNLPLFGLWILLDLCSPAHFRPNQLAGVTDKNRRQLIASATAVLCLVLLDAAGFGQPPFRRPGWGISQELDPRLLDSSLFSSSTPPVIVWAPDERSTAIASWLNRDIQMVDHPQRALLGGRIPEHQALIADLIGGHRAAYRRNDGTWGGTVRQLATWKVKWIFVPVEMPKLHRELVRTTWQPMDLDSPTVPFISTDYDEHSDVILETMAQQGFVELGPWQPATDVYDGMGWRYDAIELLGGGIDPAPAIRQSQLFRSMDIPMASLRALLPVRLERMNSSLANEFLACQKDLAYQEWMTFGKASYFRRLIVNTLLSETTAHEEPWLELNADEEIETNEQWKRCVAAYLKGRIRNALESLSGRTPSQIFAAAMMQLELGESQMSLNLLEELLSQTEDPSVLIAARYWHEQVGQFGSH